jgi:hypothetical protein
MLHVLIRQYHMHQGIALMLWQPVVAALEPQLMAQLEVRCLYLAKFGILSLFEAVRRIRKFQKATRNDLCACFVAPGHRLDAVAASGGCAGAAAHGTAGGAYFGIWPLFETAF